MLNATRNVLGPGLSDATTTGQWQNGGFRSSSETYAESAESVLLSSFAVSLQQSIEREAGLTIDGGTMPGPSRCCAGPRGNLYRGSVIALAGGLNHFATRCTIPVQATSCITRWSSSMLRGDAKVTNPGAQGAKTCARSTKGRSFASYASKAWRWSQGVVANSPARTYAPTREIVVPMPEMGQGQDPASPTRTIRP